MKPRRIIITIEAVSSTPLFRILEWKGKFLKSFGLYSDTKWLSQVFVEEVSAKRLTAQGENKQDKKASK